MTVQLNGIGLFCVVSLTLALAACGGDSGNGNGNVTPKEDSQTFMPPDTGEQADTGEPADSDDGTAVPVDTKPPCPAGTMICHDESTLALCTDQEPVLEECPANHICLDGECFALICGPGQPIGECASVSTYYVCNDAGTAHLTHPCEPNSTCFKGECVNYVCLPGTKSCLGFGAVQQCLPDGSGWEIIEMCEKGGICKDAKCISACDVDIKTATYVGCEYYSVDLDNIEDAEFEPVGLVVSVPTSSEDAQVEIVDNTTGMKLTAVQLSVSDLLVPTGGLQVFLLPGGLDINGSQKSKRSFYVKTSSPVTIHQFNPLNGDSVYTNDASLLLPTHAMGTHYVVMSWPMRKDAQTTLRGFATIIAVEPGLTEVTITPRSDVVAGGANSGVAAISKGTPTGFVLKQGDVLNLETDGEQGADLTGTVVLASQKISVFGGHECANVPLGINACDHLEQQLLPVDVWGHTYIADPFKPRSSEQFDIWRIMGGAPNVKVVTNPPQKGYETFTLHEGSYVTFMSSERFGIKATGPVMVGHYMIGSSYPGHVKTCDNTGIGDPAFTLTVPIQQYLSAYTVLTPPGYQENYINIVAPGNANITIDGVALTVPLQPVAASGWGVAQLAVKPGVHEISASSKIGLTAYGYDCDVSYAYPGGMRLKTLGPADSGAAP